MTVILSTIVVLGVLIFVHELGHFLAARSVGIRVERFSVGLGPKVFGFRRGETEYVISAIPLGGFVKMGGMDDEVMEAIEGGKEAQPAAPGGEDGEAEMPGGPSVEAMAPRSRAPRQGDFDSKSVPARAWVISAGVVMNMIFAFLAFTVVAAGWGQAAPDTTRVAAVHSEFLPAGAGGLAALPIGATITRIGDRPVAHWGDVRDAVLESPDGPVAFVYSGPSGELTAVLTGAEARQGVLSALEYWTEPVVQSVGRGSPAAQGGIQPGDRIVAVNGEEISAWPELRSKVQENLEREVELTLNRGGGLLVRLVTPSAEQVPDPTTGETRALGLGISGTGPDFVFTRVPLLAAVRTGWSDTVFVSTEILRFLRDLVTGRMSARNLGSIVTIGELSGQAAAEGLPVFLRFMALFSVNLAILNLLPIPVLDGGHLLFLSIEAVRGRPLSVQQRVRWSQVGFAVLIGIMALALGNDFLRLLGR
ncbi:MAG: RIP metalloprotease RseP [Gemmatimonadota bacterium]